MRALTLAPLLVLLGGLPAAGQPAASFTRADLQATLGWNNIRHEVGTQSPCCYSTDWMHAIALVDAGFGWYWTEHLRTTIDTAANSTGHQYQSVQASVGGQQVYRSTQIEVRQRQFGVGQQYQFGHNAWFHPHVGAGALFVFQGLTARSQPGYYYDPATRTTKTVGDFTTTDTDDSFVRPFADVGFKAYVSRRVYFVHDTRFVAGAHGLEQLAFNFGFGVDFR